MRREEVDWALRELSGMVAEMGEAGWSGGVEATRVTWRQLE